MPVLQVNDVSYFTNYSSKRSKILELLTFHINQLKEDDKNRFLEYKVRYTDLAIADEILSVEQAEHNMEFNEKNDIFPFEFLGFSLSFFRDFFKKMLLNAFKCF